MQYSLIYENIRTSVSQSIYGDVRLFDYLTFFQKLPRKPLLSTIASVVKLKASIFRSLMKEKYYRHVD